MTASHDAYWGWTAMHGMRRREWLLGCLGASCGLTAAGVAEISIAERIIRTASFRPRDLQGESPVLTGLAIHPEGRLVASCGDDHLIRLWDLEAGRLVSTLRGHQGWVRFVHFLNKGRQIISAADDGEVWLWETETAQPLHKLFEWPNPISVAACSANGELAAVGAFGSANVTILDIQRGVVLHLLEGCCSDTRALAFSPDQRLLASGGRDGKVRCWRTANGALLDDAELHRKRIRTLNFSPDGELLVSAGEDGLVRFSPANRLQGSIVLSRLSCKVLCSVFCGPQQFITGGSDNLLRVWNLELQREVETLEGHQGTVAAVACLGDLVVSGGYDATIRVWTLNAPESNAAPTAVGGEK